MTQKQVLPIWTIIAPAAGLVLLLLSSLLPANFGIIILQSFVLIMAVMAAVHHAEVVAHKIGEPFGTLVLAIAVTVIEVSLIVSLMIAGGEASSALARDTVFAAIMIILTGIIGICLLTGGVRFREQAFVRQGTSAALIVLIAIIALTLILPNYTTSIPGPFYNKGQLIFVAVVSLILYGAFVAVQTVRHRDYFLPAEADTDDRVHATPPSKKLALTSFGLLLICLVIVVLLAKKLSPTIEDFVNNIGAPQSLVGVIVALVILLPEGVAAVRAARKNRLQTSLNLALGSALASIGLTIPVVAVVSMVFGFHITLGIDAKSTLLVVLSLFTLMISFGTGRTNVLQGVVLLVLFATYLFLTVVP
jgi:Ca2+:H+ antiporter